MTTFWDLFNQLDYDLQSNIMMIVKANKQIENTIILKKQLNKEINSFRKDTYIIKKELFENIFNKYYHLIFYSKTCKIIKCVIYAEHKPFVNKITAEETEKAYEHRSKILEYIAKRNKYVKNYINYDLDIFFHYVKTL